MRGRRGKIESGKFPGHGPRCYGYRVKGERKDTELVIDEEEAEIVRMIFNWYVYGDDGNPLGVKDITTKLTSMKIPSYGDKKDKGKLRGYGVWTPGQVYPILRRETYRGIWYAYRYKSENGKRVRRPREEWVGVPVPAIIDDETWKLAQMKRKNGLALSKRNNSSHQYLMGRLISCTCGYRVHGKPSWSRRKSLYLYYRCNGKDEALTARRCDLPAFRVDSVDMAVWNWVEDILGTPGFIRQSLLEAQEASEELNQSLYDRLHTVEHLIEQNQEKLNRLLDLYLAGDFDREILVEKQTQIQQIISDLEKEKGDILINLEEIVITDEQIINIEAVAQEIRSKLNGKRDFASKRKIIEMMNVSGTLAVENGEKVIYIQCILGEDRLSVNSAIP